jgi:hypothetical protein
MNSFIMLASWGTQCPLAFTQDPGTDGYQNPFALATGKMSTIAVLAGVRCIDKPVTLAQQGFCCTSFDCEPLYYGLTVIRVLIGFAFEGLYSNVGILIVIESKNARNSTGKVLDEVVKNFGNFHDSHLERIRFNPPCNG